MKKISILSLLVLVILGCRNSHKTPDFFQCMTKDQRFDSIESKSELKGFDKIILNESDIMICNSPCWQLTTSENGNFNIEGLIWFKDNIVYINTEEDKSFSESNSQILFNFGQIDSTWIVKYNRGNGFSPYLTIKKELRFYNSDIKDSTTLFRIQKHLKNCSWIVNEFLVEVSIKCGFVSLVYWDNHHTYIINYLPTPKLSKKLPKVYFYKLK